MVIGTLFTANLNADKIYIDLTYLPDPVKNKFWMSIKNQSLVGLYFKIICNIPNWSMDTPADGKLGSVAGGVTTVFTPIITRAKPGAEATDSGNLTIEAYTDSGYTNKIGEDSLDVTTYIEDLENWTDVAKSDFDDGTAQGWTLNPAFWSEDISDEYSVEVGGYSARLRQRSTSTWNLPAWIEKSVALPDRNKVRVSWFWAYKGVTGLNGNIGAHSAQVLVDETIVFDTHTTPYIWSGMVTRGWLKFTADLSAYKGQTVALKVLVYNRKYGDGNTSELRFYHDRVVIAGKD